MKIGLLAVILLLHPVVASAENVVPPETVQLENVRVDSEMKIVKVGNAQAHYMLFCNVKLDGCLTPERGRKYLLIDQNTRWKMPGAKEFLTLAFLQDLVGKYDGATSEHIGLVEQGGGGGLGIYLLDRTGGGRLPTGYDLLRWADLLWHWNERCGSPEGMEKFLPQDGRGSSPTTGKGDA
jgi:hypothetical protein